MKELSEENEILHKKIKESKTTIKKEDLKELYNEKKLWNSKIKLIEDKFVAIDSFLKSIGLNFKTYELDYMLYHYKKKIYSVY